MSMSKLEAVWDGLISGEYKVKSWSDTEETWSMVLSRSRGSVLGPPPRDLKILKHALLCGETAQVAARAKLSKSSIAVIEKTCLEFMGLDCTPLRVPGLLVVAALVHQRRPSATRRPPPRMITIPRPDRSLAASLTPAEYEVVKLVVEGHSYAEIAWVRDTSTRTVANQVAVSFRRLGVSGRRDLLSQLADSWVRDQRK